MVESEIHGMQSPKPTRSRRYSDTFKSAALARVAAGETAKAVADDLGIGSALIARWRRLHGRPRKARTKAAPSGAPRRPKASPDTKAAVLDALEAGMKWPEIQARFEVGPGTIYKWAKKSGRFLFGEKAPVIGSDPSKDRWWLAVTGLDEETAEVAVRLLEAGSTMTEFMKATGWSETVCTTFVLRANAAVGAPKLRPGRRQMPQDDLHAETAIDWSIGWTRTTPEPTLQAA